MNAIRYDEFKSQLIRSMQDAHGINSPKVDECRRILESPTGELIIRVAILAASKRQ